MSKKLQFQGQWDDGGHAKIDCRLPLIIFEEEGNTIIYCPPLDLSGYGNSEEEAKRSWKTELEIYFNYTMTKKSLAADLTKLGWTIKKSIRKKITPPTMSYLLDNNEDFKDIFDNHEYKKIDTTVGIPAIA